MGPQCTSLHVLMAEELVEGLARVEWQPSVLVRCRGYRSTDSITASRCLSAALSVQTNSIMSLIYC